ncbi:hypothetical protein [Methylobacterium haplocladii]|uniref:Uncharacterized protein n=1 Tax=Methylobacterium haplocladii TaxID=1176176 RepID=A0A512IPG8_9HYPH|nr:hypothetical protein [Methylobacterium haplocladii]GEO99585.1 hypothetical protein MHA02_19730 [Methylobacterium haplocladii]GLS58561.1 hypothetical protein GCM10007887_12250 [Methylobacterium haplocladii]
MAWKGALLEAGRDLELDHDRDDVVGRQRRRIEDLDVGQDLGDSLLDGDTDAIRVAVFRREGAGDLLCGVTERPADEARQVEPAKAAPSPPAPRLPSKPYRLPPA